jgi:hypothetical protein
VARSASPRSHAAHLATPRLAAPLSAAGPESRPGSWIFVRYHSGIAHAMQSLIEWARDSFAISLAGRGRRAGNPTPATSHSEGGWNPVPEALHSLRRVGLLVRRLTLRGPVAARLCHNCSEGRGRPNCRSAVAGGSRAGGGQAKAGRSARRRRGRHVNIPARSNFKEIRHVQFGGASHEPLVAPVLLGPPKINHCRGMHNRGIMTVPPLPRRGLMFYTLFWLWLLLQIRPQPLQSAGRLFTLLPDDNECLLVFRGALGSGSATRSVRGSFRQSHA